MFSRSMRAETRNRAKDELKRVINSIDRVRKWERKWVVIKDTTMRIYKWQPVSSTSDATIRSPLSERKPLPGSDDSKLASDQLNSNDNSQDSFPNGSGEQNNVRRTDFSALNEDSVAGFSETGFESDSNQGFSRDTYQSGEGSTDFSIIAAATAAEQQLTADTSVVDDNSLEPPTKRMKTM